MPGPAIRISPGRFGSSISSPLSGSTRWVVKSRVGGKVGQSNSGRPKRGNSVARIAGSGTSRGVLSRLVPSFEPKKLMISIPNSRSRSEEHTSELQSLMRNSYAVFCLKKKKKREQIFSNYTKSETNTHAESTD